MDRGRARVKVVVDTNVIAYYLLGTLPFAEEASQLWRRIEDPVAPSAWEAELTNVLWMAIRAGVLSLEEAEKRLGLATRLGIRSVPSRTLWHGALARAVESGVAAYDTLFVELAIREKRLLATFDRKVLERFPEVARLPSALLADA